MNPKRSLEIPGVDGPVTFPSPDEIQHHIARSRQLRAEAMAAMLASVGRALARPLNHITYPLSRRQRRQQTYELLMRCSDRVLADIGIEREEIPLIVRGIDPRAPAPDQGLPLARWRAMRVRREALRRARRESLRIHDELMAYDDRELDDLGIRRVDIPSVIRGRVPASAFE